MCQKNAGTCCCPGCNAYFCDDDFGNHRKMLTDELDGIIAERNELAEKFKRVTLLEKRDNSLLSQIDEWQETIIEKVKKVAEQARQQVLNVVNFQQGEVSKQFQTISQELKQLKDTKGAVEQSLTRLKQQINELNEDLDKISQSSTIELNTKQSDHIVWDRMIYVEEKSAPTSNQPHRSSGKGKHPKALNIVFSTNYQIQNWILFTRNDRTKIQ